MISAPVVVLAFNRSNKLERCLSSLLKCPEAKSTPITVYIDGPRTPDEEFATQQTASVARSFGSELDLTLVMRASNLGLSQSMISAVSESLARSETVVVLEDDLEVSPFFLTFMNDGLDVYRDVSTVATIGGYWYPTAGSSLLPETFFLRGADTWGWATWREKWAVFNPDAEQLLEMLGNSGELDLFDFGGHLPISSLLERNSRGTLESWHTRWYASTFLAGMVSLYPNVSLVNNTGGDGSGVHGASRIPPGELAKDRINVVPQLPTDCTDARREIEAYFSVLYSKEEAKGRMQRLVRTLRRRVRDSFVNLAHR